MKLSLKFRAWLRSFEGNKFIHKKLLILNVVSKEIPVWHKPALCVLFGSWKGTATQLESDRSEAMKFKAEQRLRNAEVGSDATRGKVQGSSKKVDQQLTPVHLL